jgi:hypothetical protein
MKKRMKRKSKVNYESDDDELPDFETTDELVSKRARKKQYDGHVPAGLPDRFYDENGEVNLSKVKLNDALKYLNGMGFKFPFKGTSAAIAGGKHGGQ